VRRKLGADSLLSVALPHSLHAQVRALADRENETVAVTVRAVLRAAVARNGRLGVAALQSAAQ
jgi:hypothetical protein